MGTINRIIFLISRRHFALGIFLNLFLNSVRYQNQSSNHEMNSFRFSATQFFSFGWYTKVNQCANCSLSVFDNNIQTIVVCCSICVNRKVAEDSNICSLNYKLRMNFIPVFRCFYSMRITKLPKQIVTQPSQMVFIL